MGVSYKTRWLAIAASVVMSSSVASAFAAPPEYSEIMPRASRSLLLDVTSAGKRVVVAGERGHVLYSDDHGIHWVQAKVPTTQMLTAVYFVDDKHGWAVGHDGIIVASQDGGESWVEQRDGLDTQKQDNIDKENAAKQKVKDIKAALASGSNPDLEAELEDAEADLEEASAALSEPVVAPALLDVWFKDANVGWAVGAFGTFLATVDGGKTWVDARSKISNEDGFHLNAIAGTSGGVVFVAGESGMVLRSDDAGQTWKALELPYEGSIFTIVSSSSGDLIVVGGLRGNVLYSNDMGETWQASRTNTDLSLAGATINGDKNVVLVGAGGVVISSHDAAQNFAVYVQENHLPLSSIVGGPEGKFMTVGLGGVYSFTEQPK